MGILFYSILFVLNVLAFGLYAWDKHQAVYDKRRIPEYVLLGLAVIGGVYGALCAMWLFRHKTFHNAFRITVPICFFVWAAVVVLCRIL